MSDPLPPHFIVIVPGFLGSKLRDKDTGKIVWPDFQTAVMSPTSSNIWLDNLTRVMAYPNDRLEPAGIVEQVLFVPGLIKQEQYSQLLEALESMGYRASPDRHTGSDLNVHCFSYDWRQDNRISARQLGAAIEKWEEVHPGAKAVIIAHSNGGLVARWYVEKEGGKDHTCRLFMMACPWDGVPKVMDNLVSGVTLFGAAVSVLSIGERVRRAMRTFPSVYQFLPHQAPILQGPNHEVFDVLTDYSWLGDEQAKFAALVQDGKRFIEELGTSSSVETWSFFGEWQKTPSLGTVTLDANGRWQQIQWEQTDQGDDTLPVVSAVLPSAHKKIGVNAGHGHIFMHPAVLERLRNELCPSPLIPGRIPSYGTGDADSRRVDENLPVVFTSDRDSYRPGEEIRLSARFEKNRLDLPPNCPARIQIVLEWIQDLQGPSPTFPPGTLGGAPATDLQVNDQDHRDYEGKLIAPEIEGYYRVHAAITSGVVKGDLTTLIAIQAAPPN